MATLTLEERKARNFTTGHISAGRTYCMIFHTDVLVSAMLRLVDGRREILAKDEISESDEVLVEYLRGSYHALYEILSARGQIDLYFAAANARRAA